MEGWRGGVGGVEASQQQQQPGKTRGIMFGPPLARVCVCVKSPKTRPTSRSGAKTLDAKLQTWRMKKEKKTMM